MGSVKLFPAAQLAWLRCGLPSGQYLLHGLVIYLLYAVVISRTFLILGDDPQLGRIVLLLAVFGVLLVLSNWLYTASAAMQSAYLILQAFVFVLLIRPGNFKQDFFAYLLLTLSLQAVLFFGRRRGYLWVGAFVVLAAVQVLLSWQWQLSGVALVILLTAGLFFIASYAHLVRTAEIARRNNLDLYAQLKDSYQRLLAAASRAEAYAVLQERSRMARELHDSATQTIFGMNLAVQAARLLAVKNSDKMIEQLDRLVELAQCAIGEIQALTSQLRSTAVEGAIPGAVDTPVSGAAGGLTAAMRRLTTERSLRDGLEIQLNLMGERALAAPVAAGLYRIVQEALTNVARHAGDPWVSISLDLEAEPACLEIRDQGCGYDLGQLHLQGSHFGVLGMHQRAREINWSLHVESQPGAGTRVRVTENPA